MKWSRSFGQLEGFIKVYSDCENTPSWSSSSVPGRQQSRTVRRRLWPTEPAPAEAARLRIVFRCSMTRDNNALWNCGNLAAGTQGPSDGFRPRDFQRPVGARFAGLRSRHGLQRASTGRAGPQRPPQARGALRSGRSHRQPRGPSRRSARRVCLPAQRPGMAGSDNPGRQRPFEHRRQRGRLGNRHSSSWSSAPRPVTPPAPRRRLPPACGRPTPSADARGCRTPSTPRSPARPRTRRATPEDTPPRTSATATAAR